MHVPLPPISTIYTTCIAMDLANVQLLCSAIAQDVMVGYDRALTPSSLVFLAVPAVQGQARGVQQTLAHSHHRRAAANTQRERG